MLLNPVTESQVIDKTTDKKIYRAVMGARHAQEHSIVEGGDDDTEDDGPIEDCPTCHEAHQVASVINRYIEGNGHRP